MMSAEKQKMILLVDDEVIIAMAEKMILEKYGYKVIIANTGEEAVAAVAKTPAIDLILMDINLGAGIDGPEAAAIILREHDLPVVFLSSHTEPEVVAKTEKITSYGYVVKNSSNTVLDASIKMAFKLFEAKIKEKEKEKALRESEASYRVLFSGASDGILLADSRTKQFHFANPAICRMLGYTEDEFMRISVADIHPKESLDHVLAEFAALARGEIRSSPELPCLRKDGTVFYADISHSAMTLEGRKYHAGFFHDITERKRANDILRESELRSKAQYQGMPIPTFTWQKQGEDFKLIDYNEAAGVITHEKAGEFIGRKASDLYANRKDILQDLNQCFEEKKVLKREYLSEHFIPGNRMVLTIVPVPPDLVMVHMEDISGQKRAESQKEVALEALRQSEAKQSNALQMTKSGHWEYDVDRDLFTFNDNFYRIFRTTAAVVGGYQLSSGEYARRFCHPDDMAMVGIETRGAIESPDPHYSRQFDHRILYADGEVGTIAVRFFIVKDAQGRTVKSYGVNQDISERKRAEEESKRQLAEKEILLKEVHHRIKNNIASVGSLISLRLQSVTNPEAIAVLKDAIGQVDSMRILYDKLLLSEDYKDVSVKNYIESLSETVVTLFPGKSKITLEKRIADFQLDSKRLFPLGIIINELITNAMKYAFDRKKSGLIQLSLAKVDSHVTLIIQDNGIGLPDDFDSEKSKGFGLMLVKMLSQQLGGSFSLEKHKGTRCTVEFNI